MKRFLDVFLEEWKLAETQRLERADVRRKLSPPAFPVYGAHFDVPLKEGEIRIFADVPEPLVALLLKRRARGDWLLVPVSPFTVPATEQEIILGERVYQIWNAFTASHRFTSRSWLVDTPPAEDSSAVWEALEAMWRGDAVPEELAHLVGEAIHSASDPRLDYERAYIADGSIFEEDASVAPSRHRWLKAAIAAAAGIAAAVGIGYLALPSSSPGFDSTVYTITLHDPDAEPTGGFQPQGFSWSGSTASYTVLRRAIVEESRLPPPGSIKADELLNALAAANGHMEGAVAAEPVSCPCPWRTGHLLCKAVVDPANGLSIDFGKMGVASYRLLGYGNDSFTDSSVPLELGPSPGAAPKSVLVELVPRSGMSIAMAGGCFPDEAAVAEFALILSGDMYARGASITHVVAALKPLAEASGGDGFAAEMVYLAESAGFYMATDDTV